MPAPARVGFRSGPRPRLSAALCAALGAALLAGCGAPAPTLPPLAPDAVILAFGNSLTFGTGANPNESYPAVLERLTGRRVVNAGVPGEVTDAGLRRLAGVLERERPQLVVLCHGGNDILRKRDPVAAERNLREMVGLARASGSSVVLLGIPGPGLILSAADHYERIAEDLDLPYDGDIVPELLGDNRFKSDAIHPNAAGYERLAGAVQALLHASGAL